VLTGSFGIDLTLLVAAVCAVVLTGLATKKFERNSAGTEGGTTVLALPVWTILWQVILVNQVGMKSSAAMTVSWIAFAIILMGIGFIYRNRALRLWSFGAFGLTVAKVLLSDLAYLDAGIRVVILLALGMAMIAGGYWYIRTGSPRDKSS
jgi:uncharacterized membrane protein